MSDPVTFEKAAEKLEGIVKQLESDSISLDESLALFEEGVKLSRFCSQKLDEAEKKILVLVEDSGNGLSLQPLEPDNE